MGGREQAMGSTRKGRGKNGIKGNEYERNAAKKEPQRGFEPSQSKTREKRKREERSANSARSNTYTQRPRMEKARPNGQRE